MGVIFLACDSNKTTTLKNGNYFVSIFFSTVFFLVIQTGHKYTFPSVQSEYPNITLENTALRFSETISASRTL